jgi:ribosomal protein S18 acetylase RimI-like enzyme
VIAIRPAGRNDTPDIARIHIDMWRLAYDGILSEEYLRELSYSRSQMQWQIMVERHAGVLLVAESSDEGVVGFAAGGAGSTAGLGVDAEIMALYVLSSQQRNGTGKALTIDMARRLGDHGRKGLFVWVLADNPARRFYEHLGGTEVAEQTITVGDRECLEVAYVWQDLAVLIG